MSKDEKRVVRVMFKEMICSDHGARCFIEATRRDNAKRRAVAAPKRGRRK